MKDPASSDVVEGLDPPLTVPGSQKKDWVRAVQGEQKGLTKYDVEVTMKDGVGSVIVPDEIIKDASPLWEDFLMGKFLDKAPHIAKVHAIVNKIWTMGDKSSMVEVFVINSNTMKFKIPNQGIRNKITRRGMWNLAGVPVVMSKWTPFIEDDQPEEKSIPLWVHLKNVPTNMVSWKGLSFITSPVGVPARLHPETAQCINIKVAKVFVNADLTKELPKTMNFNFHGKDTLVEYSYPWLPSRCSNCAKWGHLENACLAPKKVQQVEEVEDGEIVALAIRETDNVAMRADTPMEDTEEVTTPSAVIAETHGVVETEDTMNSDGKEEKVVEPESTTNTEGEEWMDVSPSKASRSPKKTPETEEVSILSASRFSVLSLSEEGEEEELEKPEDMERDTEQAKSEGIVVGQKKKNEKEVILRQSLPRGSKDNHRYLTDTKVQKAKETPALNKTSSRKAQ